MTDILGDNQQLCTAHFFMLLVTPEYMTLLCKSKIHELLGVNVSKPHTNELNWFPGEQV